MAANPIEREPVVTAALAAALTWLAAYFGLQLEPEQAAATAAFVLFTLVPFVRQLVRPTGTPPQPPPTAEPAPPADGMVVTWRRPPG
jgi:hypothetical protein